jgi:S1-C subfamily serine protease
VHGALVTSVDADSTAAEAGLKEGDVLTEIDHHTVDNADDAVALTEKVKASHVLVRAWRNGGSVYLVVDNSAKK